jgi:2-oxo-4-hydroxy-4-carboxy--5-ureidoimidazoline (OHCU) decarboxylase
MHNAPSIPSLDALNAMSADEFTTVMGPLVEGARGFLSQLAAARPFTSDAAMVDAMHEVASAMAESDQVELLQAHPRIGGDPAEMSVLSTAEQDAEEEVAAELAAEEAARIGEELAMLNDLYEGRFGFRYVVFVAGRPKAAIVPLIEHALRNDRDAELRRAVHDAIYIAGDRLARLRGTRDDGEEAVE